jgi:hypothetical protein
MTSGTGAWLSYTDGILQAGGPTAEEVFTLMSVQRGPDYVRLANGTISPRLEDRGPAKTLTTAVIRAFCFANAAYASSTAASSGSEFTNFVTTLRGHGYSQAEAEAFAARRYVRPVVVTGPQFNRSVSCISARVLAQLGEKSHFALKVRKAAAILGISIR